MDDNLDDDEEGEDSDDGDSDDDEDSYDDEDEELVSTKSISLICWQIGRIHCSRWRGSVRARGRIGTNTLRVPRREEKEQKTQARRATVRWGRLGIDIGEHRHSHWKAAKETQTAQKHWAWWGSIS